MADPRPLFYVSAFVIAALLLWVVSVLVRPGPKWAEPKKLEDKRPPEDVQPAA
jgi:hypothetical protein